MVRINSPEQAAPVLEIKLNQNPNSYFFPASTISGHVVYHNHYGNADYDLQMTFAGVNKVSLKETSGPAPEKATLFEYNSSLHRARKGKNHVLPASRQADISPKAYAFKHRFPSSTDNRSFSLAGNTFLDTSFSNHLHDLPPTFAAHSDAFKCSVEYTLRAELYHDNCLVTSHTLPVMFLPYMHPIHGTRGSPNLFAGIDQFSDNGLGKFRKDSLVSHYPDTVLHMGVELPHEITMLQAFRFEVQIQTPFALEYEDEMPEVKVLMLRMIFAARCRLVESTTSEPFGYGAPQYEKTKSIVLHPTLSSKPTTFDVTSNTLCYTFEATLPSYYSPSFRSFLVSNTYKFEGPVQLSIDGRKLELPLSSSNVSVLSPVSQAQVNGHRRPSAMTTTSARHATHAAYSRA